MAPLNLHSSRAVVAPMASPSSAAQSPKSVQRPSASRSLKLRLTCKYVYDSPHGAFSCPAMPPTRLLRPSPPHASAPQPYH
ncbi:hypothetical protein O3P69_020579 [Scylla paramamosain]|uniref:Uncharacterized protein n=1 Tax=Scylla paramamosain TaxID=85552 RepID=A0AAW0TQP6_SCYPA